MKIAMDGIKPSGTSNGTPRTYPSSFYLEKEAPVTTTKMSPTANDGKAMTAAEALEIVREATDEPNNEEAPTQNEIDAALRVLSALAEENERLTRQVGIEQRKVADLDGLLAKYHGAAEENAALRRDLLDAYAAATEKNKELAKVRAEVERMKLNRGDLAATVCRMTARAEKAEAELTSLRCEADAARPLLERAKYLREEVLAFAGNMEAKLREHDDKPGWEGMANNWLFLRLKDEVEELEDAMLGEGDAPIADEAADVANFAMMIAYRARKEKEGKE